MSQFSQSSMLFVLIVSLAALAQVSSSLYLPGAAPQDYHDGDSIELFANVLTSIHTHMPYEYYQLPVCSVASKGPKPTFSGGFGEVFLGNRLQASPYEVVVGSDFTCKKVCDPITLSADQQKILRQRIRNEYNFNFILDNLPVAYSHPSSRTFTMGVPLGFSEGSEFFLNNHIHFTVKYYELTVEDEEENERANVARRKDADSEDYGALRRIISFTATPLSVKHGEGCIVSPSSTDPLPVSDGKVTWSYGVTWIKTEEEWATRWDVYLNVTSEDVHWFSITNATLLVVFLTAVIAMMVTFTLRKDISRYNADIDLDEIRDETGWKLVSKDVFRPPPHGWLLASLVGTGVQLLIMAFCVVGFAYLGFFTPQHRGRLFTALLFCFVFLGSTAGFTSARLLKSWGTPSWRGVFASGTLIPGSSFFIFVAINVALWTQSSSAAPLSTVVGVILMWFCISLPLVFTGGVVGYKRPPISVPVAPNMIPRYIPPAPWHMRVWVTSLIGGIFPFGVISVELFYILSAIWMNKFYYVFGFLILILIILVVAAAEIAIVLCYFQLCNEDYRWWWGSFFSTGSCGVYMFLSAGIYFALGSFKVAGIVPLLVYFGYMLLASLLFSVVTGTIGFLACFAFTKLIYSRIKSD